MLSFIETFLIQLPEPKARVKINLLFLLLLFSNI